MRLAAKMALWAFCAAPTAAAMVLTGAGAANAAVAAPSVVTHHPGGPGPGGPGPGPGPHCNWWAFERWNVNGPNNVRLVYHSGHYTYTVTFKQNGNCLDGKLTDPSLPPGHQIRTISGTVNDDYITFSVTYPNPYLGVRTFTGRIDRHGDVSGTWTETGFQHGRGIWDLASDANHACSPYQPWAPLRECQVFS